MTLRDLELTDWLVQHATLHSTDTLSRPFTARGMIASFNTNMW
jgi:hypothetical protein